MIRGSDHYWRDWTLQDGITGGYFYAGIDFAQAHRNGSRFTFLKACDGLYPTRFFGNAYNDAIEAGVMAGAYLWLDAGIFADVRKQAEFWYTQIKHVPCVSIDFEVFEDNAPNAADLWGAATRLRELGYSGKLLVYTNWSYWLEHANDSPAWLTLFDGIWLADPDSIPQAPYWAPPSEKTRRAPAPFSDWLFHQFSWTGDPAKYGVTNGKLEIDENNFNGDEMQLEQFFGGAVIPPPPNGGTMKATVLADKVNIRDNPSISANDVGDLFRNQSADISDLYETGVTKGADYEQWGRIGDARWIAIWYRTQGKLCELAGVITPPPTEGVTVDFIVDGVIISSKLAPSGSKVAVTLTE